MSKREKLLAKAQNNPRGLRFKELCRLAEQYGFELNRVKGDHHIYQKPEGVGFMDFQPAKQSGEAKEYQVMQLLKVLVELGVINEED